MNFPMSVRISPLGLDLTAADRRLGGILLEGIRSEIES
jgi:hypothetical protein